MYRAGARINGFTGLALTKLDVGGLEELKICVAELDGKETGLITASALTCRSGLTPTCPPKAFQICRGSANESGKGIAVLHPPPNSTSPNRPWWRALHQREVRTGPGRHHLRLV